jgi:hypothetical protein
MIPVQKQPEPESFSEKVTKKADKVETTIKRLKLNEKEKHIEYRLEFLCDYCELCRQYGNIEPAWRHLEKKAPFIAYELKRQGLTKKIVHMMRCSRNTIMKNHDE